MNKLMAGSIAIALFLIASCGAPKPGLATSAEEIVGTWQKVRGSEWYMQFFEDGTLHGSHNTFLLDDRANFKAEFRFEGAQLIMEEILYPACEEIPTAIYEVHLLETGNLQFVAIEDECAGRRGHLEGQPDRGFTSEYIPAP